MMLKVKRYQRSQPKEEMKAAESEQGASSRVAASLAQNDLLILHHHELSNIFNWQQNINKLVALSQTFPVVTLNSPPNESEAIMNFYDTYSISTKTLFRPETVFIMIKAVMGSFDRYIQAANALA